MEKRPTLNVPSLCRWYRGGDTNRKPLAAIVTASDDSGILDIVVFVPNARQSMSVAGVRHKDDPFLKDRPEVARSGHNGMPGCWDFIETSPAYRPFDLSQAQVVAVAIVEQFGGPQKFVDAFREQWIEEKLRMLRSELGDNASQEIAKRMTELTGEDWNHQRVNAILRKAIKES